MLYTIAGLGVRYGSPNLVIYTWFLFEFLYNITNGGVFWLYVAEITSNKGIAIVASIRMVTVLFLDGTKGITFEYLGNDGFFFFYAIL